MSKEMVSGLTVGVPLVNEMTSDGIITALRLEQFVVGGMTVGAIFKLLMLVALALLVVERALSILNKYREWKRQEEK